MQRRCLQENTERNVCWQDKARAQIGHSGQTDFQFSISDFRCSIIEFVGTISNFDIFEILKESLLYIIYLLILSTFIPQAVLAMGFLVCDSNWVHWAAL